ncbi:MAG TPA: hypothetical protein VM580_02160, partial [Labilithrix sp.]|nr:hypothetical protein [Labilithrix sp.]
MKAAHLSFLSLLALATASCDSCSKAPPAGADATISDAEATPLVVADAGVLNVTPIPTASVAAKVNPEGLPAYTGPTGSVEGTISVMGDPAPETPGDFKRCPDAAKMYGRAFRE